MLKGLFTILLFISSLAFAKEVAVFETNFGKINMELYSDKAPVTVKNFKSYIKKGFYNGTIFHRVIDNFMIQGGGYNERLQEKATDKPIVNEAHNGLQNEIGSVAMARTNVVNSATSQFFINVSDNNHLNHRNKTPVGYGYTVFGRVTKGMSVVNRIKMTKTTANGPFQNLPAKNIIIKKAYIQKL